MCRSGGGINTGVGSFGLTATWLWNNYNQGSDSNIVQSDTYELAAYWHGSWGGFSAYARGSVGRSDFNGRRTFTGLNGTQQVEKSALAERSGTKTADIASTNPGAPSIRFGGAVWTLGVTGTVTF